MVVRVKLRASETLTGQVSWWDLIAFELETGDDELLIIVQRHIVLDW